MPFQAAHDAAPGWVTPRPGKGALGTWRSRTETVPDTVPDYTVYFVIRGEPESKPMTVGVYVGQHLSFTVAGKAFGGQAKLRTGLGQSDRPGSQGGLWKRGPWWN